MRRDTQPDHVGIDRCTVASETESQLSGLISIMGLMSAASKHSAGPDVVDSAHIDGFQLCGQLGGSARPIGLVHLCHSPGPRSRRHCRRCRPLSLHLFPSTSRGHSVARSSCRWTNFSLREARLGCWRSHPKQRGIPYMSSPPLVQSHHRLHPYCPHLDGRVRFLNMVVLNSFLDTSNCAPGSFLAIFCPSRLWRCPRAYYL